MEFIAVEARGSPTARQHRFLLNVTECLQHFEARAYLEARVVLDDIRLLFEFLNALFLLADAVIPSAAFAQLMASIAKTLRAPGLNLLNLLVNRCQAFDALLPQLLPARLRFNFRQVHLKPLKSLVEMPFEAVMRLDLFNPINAFVNAGWARQSLAFAGKRLNLPIEFGDAGVVLMVAQTHRVDIVNVLAVFLIKREDAGIREVKLTLYRFNLVGDDFSDFVRIGVERLNLRVDVADGINAASSRAPRHLMILAGLEIPESDAVELLKAIKNDGACRHVDTDSERLCRKEELN